MLVAAHAGFIARDAGHVLVHAVRLGRTVPVAAVLKAEPPPTKKEGRTKSAPGRSRGNTRAQTCEERAPVGATETERVQIPHGAKHTALLVKALRAGEAVPGVICQKHT